MHAKVKITLLFTAIMLVLLSALCSYIYYSFYTLRAQAVKEQLYTEALVVSRFFSSAAHQQDSLLQNPGAQQWLPVGHKRILVYDAANHKLFAQPGKPGNTSPVSNDQLNKAKTLGTFFFSNEKEDVLIYYDAGRRLSIAVAAYDEAGRKNLTRVAIILGLCFVAGIFISFVSGYYFSRFLLKPVKRIADEVNHISVQNLGHRIPTGKSDDEWNYLTQTLNELLDRLQESFLVQRRFISAASHELSTPLTTISSQLEVALQNERSGTAYKEVMSSVYQSVQQLIRLTQILLRFASISGNAGGIELHPVRIDEVLMRLPGDIAKTGAHFSVKLNFKNLPSDEKALLVFGNEELLFSAFNNIVFNACKYSADHTANVTLAVGPETVVITVRDNGRGISPEELEHIFQPFYRTGNSKQVPGFGMGLPLVKRIINLHKGEITVQSEPGAGTEFCIVLPVAANK